MDGDVIIIIIIIARGLMACPIAVQSRPLCLCAATAVVLAGFVLLFVVVRRNTGFGGMFGVCLSAKITINRTKRSILSF